MNRARTQNGPLYRMVLAPFRPFRWLFAAVIDLVLRLAPTGVVPGPGQQEQRSHWRTALNASRGLAISALVIGATGGVLWVSRATSAEVGSGQYVTVVRRVGSFNELVIGGGQRVTVRVEPGAQSEITVFTDDNLAPLVRTRRFGNRVVIDTERDLSQSIVSEVRIVTGTLLNIVVRERAVVEVFSLEGSSLTVDVSGGGQLFASGAVARVDLRTSGSRIDFQALVAAEVVVDARDGAVVNLHAREAVSGEASGGSEVRVSGGPATLEIEVRGDALVCEGSTTVAFTCRH